MNSFLQDLRYSLRMMRKTPMFTAIVLLTLALGIGANVAIFTFVDSALLRPLPFTDPDSLVHLWEISATRQPPPGRPGAEASIPNYQDWKRENTVFSDLAGYSRSRLALTGAAEPEMLEGGRVTSSFFSVLGVNPSLGRTFAEGEDVTNGPRVVLLTNDLWRRRFAASPQIVGQTVTLGGNAYEVIGVLPPEFRFAPLEPASYFVPLHPRQQEMEGRGYHFLNTIARLKPGVSIDQATAQMQSIAASLAQRYPEENEGNSVALVDLRTEISGRLRPVLLVLMGTVALVLLLACVNVANLLISRAAARQREIAVRVAIGATPRRLAQQLITETLFLGILGGALGIMVAQFAIDFLSAGIPASSPMGNMPALRNVSLDWRIIGFASLIAIGTGVLVGLAPLWQSIRPQLFDTLRDQAHSQPPAARKLRSTLIVAEVSMAMLLLVGAGLMTRSLVRLLDVDPGFSPERLVTFRMVLPTSQYSEDEQLRNFRRAMLDRVSALPGVQGVTTTTKLPLDAGNTAGFFRADRPQPPRSELPSANIRVVSPNYFEVMQIPVLQGRGFTPQDDAQHPLVVVVNRTFAERVFRDEDPLGKEIANGETRFQIAGVVKDVKIGSLDEVTPSTVYFPYDQSPSPGTFVAIRTTTEPMALMRSVQAEIQSIDPQLPVYAVSTMEDRILTSPATFMRRYPALLIGGFALVALLLAIIGIYGVLSYSVTQRTREIGVRMALGAQHADVTKLFVGQGFKMVGIGIAVGLGLAFAGARLISSLLYGVTTTDWPTFVGLPLLLLGVALLASYIPARRAARLNPILALRQE